MKQLLKLVLTIVSFILLLLFLYLPFGRVIVPQIGSFLIGGDSIWEVIRVTSQNYNTEILTQDIQSKVYLERDEIGFFTISAEHYNDAMTGLGYAMAFDRYYQMSFYARAVSGELSEWFGSSFNDTDRLMLNMGLDERAWEILRTMDDKEYELISRFSNGVNGYINDVFRVNKPIEYKLMNLNNRYWRPVDAVRLMLLYSFFSSAHFEDFYIYNLIQNSGKQLVAKMGEKKEIIGLDGKKIKISNVISNKELVNSDDILKWLKSIELNFNTNLNLGFRSSRAAAIAGNIDYNGKNAVLSQQSYEPLSLPNKYYPVRLKLPNYTILGFTIPGIPAIFSGTNGKISWTHIPILTDNVNLYESTDPATLISKTKDYRVDGKKITVNFAEEDTPLLNYGNQSFFMNWHGKQYANEFLKLKTLATSDLTNDLKWLLDGSSQPNSLLIIQSKDAQFAITKGIDTEFQTWGIEDNLSFKVPRAWMNTAATQHSWTFYSTNPGSANLNHPFHLSTWSNNHLNMLVKDRNIYKTELLYQILNDDLMIFKPLMPLIKQVYRGELNSKINLLINEMERWNFSANSDGSYVRFFLNLDRMAKTTLWPNSAIDYYPSTDNWLNLVISNQNNTIFNQYGFEDGRAFLKDIVAKTYDLTILENGTPENWFWYNDNILNITHPGNIDWFKGFKIQNQPFSGSPLSVNFTEKEFIDKGPVLTFLINLDDERSSIYMRFLGGISGSPYSEYNKNYLSSFFEGKLSEITLITDSNTVKGDKITLYPSK